LENNPPLESYGQVTGMVFIRLDVFSTPRFLVVGGVFFGVWLFTHWLGLSRWIFPGLLGSWLVGHPTCLARRT
jgi:hypothetical protein